MNFDYCTFHKKTYTVSSLCFHLCSLHWWSSDMIILVFSMYTAFPFWDSASLRAFRGSSILQSLATLKRNLSRPSEQKVKLFPFEVVGMITPPVESIFEGNDPFIFKWLLDHLKIIYKVLKQTTVKKTKDSMQSSLCTWGKHSHLLYHEVHQWGKRLAQPSKAPLTPLPVDPRPWKYFGYKEKKTKQNKIQIPLLFIFFFVTKSNHHNLFFISQGTPKKES